MQKGPIGFKINFTGSYHRKVIYNLSRIQWLSIIGDNYFRLIRRVGVLFLGFIFWMGFGQQYDAKEFPPTVMLMDIYNHNFLLFVFIILLFYTGETVHREKQIWPDPNKTLVPGNHRLTQEEHILDIKVKGKPDRAGIDPYGKLIDRQPEDNVRVF